MAIPVIRKLADPRAPIHKQSAPVVGIERAFSQWFMREKALVPHEGDMPIMLDITPDGVLRMIPVEMDDEDNWKAYSDQDTAFIDAAFRNLSVNDNDPERASRIRATHDRVRGLYAKAANGQVVKRAMLDRGLNLTAMAANVPVYAMIPALIQLLGILPGYDKLSGEEKLVADQKIALFVNMMLSVVRGVADSPMCQLFDTESTASPKSIGPHDFAHQSMEAADVVEEEISAALPAAAPSPAEEPAYHAPMEVVRDFPYNEDLADVSNRPVAAHDDLAYVPNAQTVGYDDTASPHFHADPVRTDTFPQQSAENSEGETPII